MSNKSLIERSTISRMIGEYDIACREISEAYALLEKAQNRLRHSFADTHEWHFKLNQRNLEGVGENVALQIKAKVKREAWAAILEKMAIMKLLSIHRRDKLEKQLQSGRLPNLTEDAILSMYEQTGENFLSYLEERCCELYAFLRPPNSPYATNSPFGLGEKVILTSMVEVWDNGFRPLHDRRKWFTALEATMYALDGRGVPETHYGSLYDAIMEGHAEGETEYYKFHCYKNGNLHLQFRRKNLVKKLNVLVGKKWLKL